MIRVPDPPAGLKLVASTVLGAVAGTIAGLNGAGKISPLIGWDVLATLLCGWIWLAIWNLDPELTSLHAQRDDPGRKATDIALVSAALSSLLAVGYVLFGAGQSSGSAKYWHTGFAVFSVFVSWLLIHTVFTLRYARQYYTDTPGGVSFNEDDPPQYSDFAYLAFSVGMTYQVSDTNIENKEIRRIALRHALISFPMGTVIIATVVSLISGLGK